MKDKKNSREEINEDKELDGLFDELKTSKLNKAVKKAKLHSILRNILISILVFGVIVVGGSIANRGIVDKMWSPVELSVSNFNEISAPNQYIGKTNRYQGFLGGKSEYTTYKIIEGKVVYTGESDYNYGLFKNYHGSWIGSSSPLIIGQSWDAGDLELQRYNQLGQREMVFFYPFLTYSYYKNDLELLDDLPPYHVMEMALSFDQEYSMEEVNNKLPENVTLAWYWINDLNEQEIEASRPRVEEQYHSDGEAYTVDYPAKLRSEKTAYGIKAYNPNGTPLEDPEQYFIWALQNGMKYDTRFKSEFERVFQNIAGEDNEISKEDLRVWGVVVTGDAESLNTLRDLPFIKAASLGVITERY